ncbi:MBL fold metallo-hydrolase [Ruminococcus sp.]|uniref:MBL fold metallo-hydrolase n=1 Tax=Ruminococcus sp. TaxID=41978 RepID=UPI0025DE1204|nr:MBL fold metallo-hydrolase [Ruminococcus sp.]MBQ8966127.1 MBL fold metallo-hydrolase [Ruminococcus sp.]
MHELITVNEQSSIRISAEKVIYFDPLHISCAPHDADIVFITHEHYDHFSRYDIAKVSKEGTRFVAPSSMEKAFAGAGIGQGMTTFMHPAYSAEVEGIPIDAVAAYNLLKPFHPRKNGWLGYVVTVSGQRIYVCGDTDATSEAKAVKCDIICVPAGGTFTMNAKQAAELVNIIRPKTAIPTHYGTMVGKPADGEVFAAAVDKDITVVKKLKF